MGFARTMQGHCPQGAAHAPASTTPRRFLGDLSLPANHTYAPDGPRRSMHQGGSANPVSFVWDGDDLLNDYISGGVSVRYDVLAGEVLGHKGGANRYLYVPDPLGSVVNLLDTSRNIAGTYLYAPYGEVLSHTGANTAMQFVGALGYQTQITNRIYAKPGYYRPDLAAAAGPGVGSSARHPQAPSSRPATCQCPVPALEWWRPDFVRRACEHGVCSWFCLAKDYIDWLDGRFCRKQPQGGSFIEWSASRG